MLNETFNFLQVQQQEPITNSDLFQFGVPDISDLPGVQRLESARQEAQQTRQIEENIRQQEAFNFQQQEDQLQFDQPNTEMFRFDDNNHQSRLRNASGVDAPSSGSSSRSRGAEDFASFTFEREAQRDSKGRLKVFTPPSGDGGGAFEVAGITAKFQPKEAARLKSLIEAGNHDQAEREAKAFYAKRAAPFIKHTNNEGIKLQLADTVHHRGEGGLRKILQKATGSSSKSHAQLISSLSNDPKALSKFNKARNDYEWNEIDRGRASRKKFRKGLQNRFNKAHQAALNLQG